MRTRGAGATRVLSLVLLAASVAACGSQPNELLPPGPDLAGLQLTIAGLPTNIDARVSVEFEGAVIPNTRVSPRGGSPAMT